MNKITKLDVRRNTNLTYLDCHENQLPNLDVSQNTNLTALWCNNNPGNGSKFPIKAWFDNHSIPNTFNYDEYWTYNNIRIEVDFYK